MRMEIEEHFLLKLKHIEVVLQYLSMQNSKFNSATHFKFSMTLLPQIKRLKHISHVPHGGSHMYAILCTKPSIA